MCLRKRFVKIREDPEVGALERGVHVEEHLQLREDELAGLARHPLGGKEDVERDPSARPVR